MKNYIKHNKHP